MHSHRRPRRIQYALGLCCLAFGGLVRAQGPILDVSECISALTPVPCSVLESVMSSCAAADGQTFTLGNVINQNLGVYPGPAANNTALEKCQCTDVAYNLYAACAACQFEDIIQHWLSRDNYFTGCTVNSSKTQIAVVPLGMARENISLWMKQIYNPTFDIGQAIQVQDSNTTLFTGAGTSAASATSATGTVTTTSASPSSTVMGSPSPIPAIVGGAVGGGVLILFFLILFLWWRRRAAQGKRRRRQEDYDRRHRSGLQQMPIGATFISPHTPPTPGSDTAPLTRDMGLTSPGYTPASSTPSLSYFGGHNLTTPVREEPAPWTVPVASTSSSSYANSVTSPDDSNTSGRTVEKARFVSEKSPIEAPPPYSEGI